MQPEASHASAEAEDIDSGKLWECTVCTAYASLPPEPYIKDAANTAHVISR